MRLETVPVPTPGPSEALVAVDVVGLCGSDTEEYRRGPLVATPPVVLGHEIVGRVFQSAADGSGPQTGTRVVVDAVTGCGTCFWCQRHEEGLCEGLVVTGQHRDGGLAEYVVGTANRLVPIPSGLDPCDAVFAEPLAVAVRALRKTGPLLGRGVVVIGGGTIGLLVAQLAARSLAESVLVIEPNPERRALANICGLQALWADLATDRAAAVADEFSERGPDIVIECSGATSTLREAVALTRRGGLTVLLGVYSEAEPFEALDLVLHEKLVIGSAAHMWDDDVAPAVALLSTGDIMVSPLVSDVVPLRDIADAFERLTDPQSGLTKVLVDVPTQGGANGGRISLSRHSDRS